jgi:hypothetical protein
LHPGIELEKIYALHLPQAEEQQILGENALRLIRKTMPHTADNPIRHNRPPHPAVQRDNA